MPDRHRKYVCVICSKAYAKSEHLIRHERIHTGAKPFSCPWCHRAFSRPDSLSRHQQRQGHEGTPPTSLENRFQDINGQEIDSNVTDPETISTQGVSCPLTQVAPNLLTDTIPSGSHIQGFDNNSATFTADDFFLPLTWPDSEDLLQTILTSNLAPWSENVELLPTQYALNEPTQVPRDNDSPWLTQDTTQHVEGGSYAVRNVSQIISELSANVTSEAESAVLNTVFLDACLHMFFDQFTSNFPICHRPTFVFRDWTHPLLLNAIALGSLFVGQEVNVAKGEVLWKLAHTAVATSWHSLILHRGPHDPCQGIQLILTALLGQTYAMLSGTSRLRHTAQIFHSLGFYWARQCDMYNFKRKFNTTEVANTESIEQKMELWKLWAAEEIELRALLGHYILDGQLASFTGAPTSQRHASNPLPLPCSEALFRAATLEEWVRTLNTEQSDSITFRQLLLALFANAPNAFGTQLRLSTLSIKVLIEGLESFVTEANSVEGSVVGAPTNVSISTALGTLHRYISLAHHLTEGEKTELLIRWHIVGIDAAINFSHLCKNMCAQFTVDQNIFGRTKLDDSPIDLKRWIESPRARRALLHATAVWDALARLPVHQALAIHIPVSTFVAATTYGAFVLAGTTTVMLPPTFDWSKLMAIDLEDAVSLEKHTDLPAARFLMRSSEIQDAKVRNLLYDLNIFLMQLRQIRRPWSICASFESILQQWLAKCGI